MRDRVLAWGLRPAVATGSRLVRGGAPAWGLRPTGTPEGAAA